MERIFLGLRRRESKVSWLNTGSKSTGPRNQRLNPPRVSSSSSAILFFKSSTFKLGNKDLKRRTGSWRVWLILQTAVLVPLLAGSILIWLGQIGRARVGERV